MRNFPRSKSTLELELENYKRVNDYDYKKMISDFETEKRHNEIRNKIKNDLKQKSNQYNQKIAQIKKNNELLYLEKREALQKKLSEKEYLVNNSLKNRNEVKSEEKKNLIKKLVEKENRAKEIVNNYLIKQEEERLKAEEMSEQKMQNIAARSKYIKDKQKEIYAKKMEDIQKKHEKSVETCIKMREEKEKSINEATFKKFAEFHFCKKELDQQRRIYYNEKNKSKIITEERIRMLEREKMQKNKEIIDQINRRHKIKEDNDKKKEMKIELMKKNQSEKLKKVGLQKELLVKNEQMKRDVILYAESERFNNALARESKPMDLMQNEIIYDQVSFDRQYQEYKKKRMELQNNSLFKKTNMEKINMCKIEDRRKEEEIKKKLEMEKEKMMK